MIAKVNAEETAPVCYKVCDLPQQSLTEGTTKLHVFWTYFN